ncbi:MAG: hypothetical protein A2491_12490 [Bacteroidetes bacterium RIFOXYC12_FULL_35_7]|nr:MAG: hypothetical protein A2491_12490 [Bacteroidetes bacterium RIFOXYC12_FULL_35_7]
MGWAENRLGAERIHTAYAYQNLLIQNNWLSNGSDFPIESINPIYGFHAAIARKDHEGNPENGFLPDNALTREQALKAMTVWAARACFMENEIGSIKKGMAADFVIFDRDIMKEAEKNVWQFQPLETFINGQNVMKK